MKIKLLILFLFITGVIYSHPHIQILTRSTIEFADNTIKGVWMEWEFDEYFSSDIILSYDLDFDRSFNEEETRDIYNNAFISLKDFDFFTYIREGDNRWSPKSVSDFSAYLKDDKIIYKFFVPVVSQSREFNLAIYDFTYFCACFYQEEEPVNFIGAENLTPTYSIIENRDKPIYFNPYAGIGDTTVYTQMEEGLVELFIKEIKIEY